MKLFISGLAVFCGSLTAMMAQQTSGVCGNSTAEQVEHLLPRVRAYQEHAMASERSDVQYVPIYFHLAADSDGEGRLRERNVLDQLCDLNAAYTAMDIRYYLNPHPTYGLIDKSINSNTVYNSQTNEFLMNSRRHQNGLNVYVVNTIVLGGGGDGTILGFNNRQRDWVVCRKDQINGNNNGTLAHEIGHFFALPHTFLGYESNPFDGVDDPTWPIAPAIAPGGTTTERSNGTNCQTAADEICDTPPDYNFGFGAADCGPYTGAAKDPQGADVDPMENNFMGYFINCSEYQFTPGQTSVVLADREASDRNYLDNSYVPASTEVTSPADLLISPIGGVTQESYDEVLLQWQAVPGATYYLLEFDISTFFASPNYQYLILPASTTSLLYTSLLPNRLYHWRVRPFNEYATCDPGKVNNFRTPTTSSVKTIEGLDAWQVYPNPANSGNQAYVAIRSANGFKAAISIVDPAGQLLYEQRNVAIPSGETNVDLSLQGLANGIYFVVISTEHGREVRKLTILK